MDPLTMMAIAQVAVAGVGLVQNYFAGQAEITKNKRRQKQAYDLQRGQIEQRFKEGQEDIGFAAANETAGLAARGVEGAFADIAVVGNKKGRTDRLNTWHGDALSGLDMGFQNAVEDLDAASEQLNMDALVGGLGIGLSAAGAMVDAGVFNQKPVKDIFASGGGGNFLKDFSYTTDGSKPKLFKPYRQAAVAY